MSNHSITKIKWQEVSWQRPFDISGVTEMLAHLATTEGRGALVWEIRGHGGKARHLIGADEQYIDHLLSAMKVHGDIRFEDAADEARIPVTHARKVAIKPPSLSLNTEIASATIRAGLAAISSAGEDEEVVMQIILGGSYAPGITPRNLISPTSSWLQMLTGSAGQATPEIRKSVRDKTEKHSFQTVLRIGASGLSTRSKIFGVLSAIRTLESAGVRIYTDSEKPWNLNHYKVPWHFPLKLSVNELAMLLMLPVGEDEYQGTAELHPKTTYLPEWYREPENRARDRTFALAMNKQKLSISPEDSLEHTVILGPTGSGKSTTLLNLILSDIYANRSVLVIDPKVDLVNDVLERIPQRRINDVVVIDPSDPCPVGFNPLALPGNPSLIADAILASFEEIFKENWGIRSQDVLSAALLTLVETENATLLWIPELLTDDAFRQRITSEVKDKIALKPFWDNFEAMRDGERRQEIAPVLNKMRQFLFRPGLRAVLGQSNPKFQLTDLFTKRKIVLVPLNKGTVGPECAKLLGSLVVGLTWTLALSRANVAPERRHIVSMYIDELQDYLNLPTSLSDALAQARGLGVGITMAHQYRRQLSPEICAGIDANARNKIVFGVNAQDAKELAAMAPELEALDFMRLPRYEIFTNFMNRGKSTGWVRGKTLPMPETDNTAAEIRALCQATYGVPAGQVEAEFLSILDISPDDEPSNSEEYPIGRVRV